MFVLIAQIRGSFQQEVLGVCADQDRALARLAELRAEGYSVVDEDGDWTDFDGFWLEEVESF
jgi:hypothetical protein